MVESLFDLGLSENTIKTMIELNPNIIELSDNELKEKKMILEKLNCSETQIRNIISSNSLYLDRNNDDISRLIDTLIKYNFKTLNILFDSNPYILNLDSFEVERYITERINAGEELEDIIDDLDLNPYLFSDI